MLSSFEGREAYRHEYRRATHNIEQYTDLPLYIVNQEEDKATIADIYRKGPISVAKLAPTTENIHMKKIIKLDTLYFLKLFWLLEPESETFRLKY